MKKLSLRARGLLALITEQNITTIQEAQMYCVENRQYIEHSAKELSEAGIVTVLSDNRLEVVSDTPPEAYTSLQKRIFALYTNNPTYEVIGWFLGQLDKTFELDVELKERVQLEYEAASVVQFWSWDNIENAMKRALVDKSIGNVTLEDLRELLRKKDKGEIVWQK